MKAVQKISEIIISVSVILILLVTAFDVAVYADYGFFEKEYEKYDVLDDLNMEMDDVMDVTRHMMRYLKGKEDSLQITTVVNGETQDFFNDQDIFHMGEVQTLFLMLYRLRVAALVLALLGAVVLAATRSGLTKLFRTYQFCLAGFLGAAAILGIIVAVNFSEAFEIFHHLFFDNDLWLFDPRTDLMINMLPEGLFLDFTVRILVVFAALLVITEGVLLFIRHRSRVPGRKPRAAVGALAVCLVLTSLGGTAEAAELTTTEEWPSAPEIEAEGAVLIDARSGNILYEKDAYSAYPPASITKIMTTLLACELGDLSDQVTISANAVNSTPWDASKMGLSAGEVISLEDLLYGVMLKSGNEAALAVAEYIAGSEEEFANLMNERAAQIGTVNTHYVNASGYPVDDHYTCAYDMAMIMREAIQNPYFLEIASTPNYRTAPTNMNENGYSLSMGHEMMHSGSEYYYEYAVAGKTGYTQEAGNTLVTYAKKGDMELICVVLRTSFTHYDDTRLLLDYGFDNYTCYNVTEEDQTYNSEGSGFFSFMGGAFQSSPMSVQLGEGYITVPSGVEFADLTSHLDYSSGSGEDGVLGYVVYEYEGAEVARIPLLLVKNSLENFDFSEHASEEDDENGDGGAEAAADAEGAVTADSGAAYGTDESSDAGDGEGEAYLPAAAGDEDAAVTSDDNNGTRRVITINIWHVLGVIFVLALLVLVVIFLTRFSSPRQRRLRRARKMKRVYYTGSTGRRRRRRRY